MFLAIARARCDGDDRLLALAICGRSMSDDCGTRHGSDIARLAASLFGVNSCLLSSSKKNPAVGRDDPSPGCPPQLVARCVAAMKAAVKLPVTVKCRIGIDEQDPEQSLFGFAAAVKAAGADALIVHARKAWLKGLSPRENREVPPLNYEIVHRLKAAHPDWPVIINGGIGSIEMAKAHLEHVDGVMMGRAAYQEPWRLLDADPQMFAEPAPVSSAKEAALAFLPYIERELARGTRLHAMTRHMLGLFHAVPGARAFRRHLSTHAVRPAAGTEVLLDALSHVADAPALVDSQVKLPHIAA